MKTVRDFFIVAGVFLLGISLAGCHPKMDTMKAAEKIFVKMTDKTAEKLDLNGDQKIQLERLKLDLRKNFQDGQHEKRQVLFKIKREALKENPDIREMTVYLQESLRAETLRVNGAFDLMLEFQKNLDENQKRKLTQMISEWVAKWD